MRIDGLRPNTCYAVRMRARNRAGVSPWSHPALEARTADYVTGSVVQVHGELPFLDAKGWYDAELVGPGASPGTYAVRSAEAPRGSGTVEVTAEAIRPRVDGGTAADAFIDMLRLDEDRAVRDA
jgi:hypothetical protein